MELSGRGYDQIMGFCKRDNETLCYKKKAESIMTGTLSFLKEEASRCSQFVMALFVITERQVTGTVCRSYFNS